MQELDNFRPFRVTSCLDYCKYVSKMQEYKGNDQVIPFLKGLNNQYSAVRSQIMLMEPLFNISKVYSLLVQQERQAVNMEEEEEPHMEEVEVPEYALNVGELGIPLIQQHKIL